MRRGLPLSSCGRPAGCCSHSASRRGRHVHACPARAAMLYVAGDGLRRGTICHRRPAPNRGPSIKVLRPRSRWSGTSTTPGTEVSELRAASPETIAAPCDHCRIGARAERMLDHGEACDARHGRRRDVFASTDVCRSGRSQLGGDWRCSHCRDECRRRWRGERRQPGPIDGQRRRGWSCGRRRSGAARRSGHGCSGFRSRRCRCAARDRLPYQSARAWRDARDADPRRPHARVSSLRAARL